MEPKRTNRRNLLIGGAAISAAAAIGMARSPDTLPRDHQTIEIRGRRLHYTTAGSGRPLVLLHGSSGSLRDWTFAHMGRLAQQWRVIAFDRPGLGGSDPSEDHRLLGQAHMMQEALDAMGVGDFTLCGHSFGGSVALAWALGIPAKVRGLMLLGAPSHVWPGTAGRLHDITSTPVIGYAFSRALPWIVSEKRFADGLASVFAPQATPQGYGAHIDPARVLHPPVYRRNARQVTALKDQLRTMTPRYPTLVMPLEILHGEADDTVNAALHSVALHKAAPRSRLTLLPGIGHMPHHGAPDAFYDALTRL